MAFFDLTRSLGWRLGDRVRRVWFEALPTVRWAELVETLPAPTGAVEPDPEGDDWYFARPDAPAPPGARWVVGLLDLARFRYEELEAVDGPGGTLRVPGAAARVATWVYETRAPVAWRLDCRVDGVTVVRASGRRVGVRGSREETARPSD